MESSSRRPQLLVLAVVAALVACVGFLVVRAAGGDDPSVVASEASTTTAASPPSPPPAPQPTGGPSWVGVGLQSAPLYQEGFDYGIRLLRGEEVVAERRLDQFSSDVASPRTYFTSLTVEPGPLVAASDLNIGAGPPPGPIDFSDACRTHIDVPKGGGVLVQLNWKTGCLETLDASALPSLSPAPTMWTEASPGPAGTNPAPPNPKGSFGGMEEFALFTGRCPFLDHKLDATYSLSDGAKWRFHSTYCGDIDAQNRHYGNGEFTFTTANGSTLTGTFHSEAQLPSRGEPYTMQIHEGTGDYAGATGECAIDNHLEMVRFGRQRQFGTFDCTVTLPPRSSAPRTTSPPQQTDV